MNFKERLLRAREKKTTPLLKFLLSYKADTPQLFAFVEGRTDREFYRILFEARLNRRPEFIECGGKGLVYDVYPLVEKRKGALTETVYFVDKDLDDLVQTGYPLHPRLHVTEYYSVENYVVNDTAFELFFKECVRFRKGQEVNFELVLGQFKDAHISFLDLAKPIMAWILCALRKKLNPQVNNINLKQFFYFDENLVPRTRVNAPSLKDACACSELPGDLDVQKAIGDLDSLNPKQYVRGKFEAWFFASFLKKMQETLSDFKMRTLLPVEEATVLSLLASRMPRENDITEFLNSLGLEDAA